MDALLTETKLNVRLQNEIERYLREECSIDKKPAVNEVAEHFYNLAINNMRELIEKAKTAVADNTTYFSLGVTNLADILLDKIK